MGECLMTPSKIPTKWRVRWEWKHEDCWIGVYWKRSIQAIPNNGEDDIRILDIWICIIPCCPIHITKITTKSILPR